MLLHSKCRGPCVPYMALLITGSLTGPWSWCKLFVLATSLSWTSILTGRLTFKHGTSNCSPTDLYLALAENQLKNTVGIHHLIQMPKSYLLLRLWPQATPIFLRPRTSVFDGQIRTMPGEKFHIFLTDDARTFCITTPRTIPFAYRDKLQNEIDLLVSQGIITPVNELTEWCAPIDVTPKRNSDCICMCIDLSKLKVAENATHPQHLLSCGWHNTVEKQNTSTSLMP